LEGDSGKNGNGKLSSEHVWSGEIDTGRSDKFLLSLGFLFSVKNWKIWDARCGVSELSSRCDDVIIDGLIWEAVAFEPNSTSIEEING
jgi:hypothetical protein